MIGVIYLITNKLNGMQYVGLTTKSLKERIRCHKYGKLYIDYAIRKYGLKNFTLEVIEECDTLEQLIDREIFRIAALNTKIPNGYNCTDGGEGILGWHHSEDTRAQMSVDRSGENNAFFGKNHTNDICFTISVSHRKYSPYKNLLNEIDKLHLTYTALAKLMGLRESTLSEKMRGKLNFTVKDKVKLEEIFGLPADYLLQRDEG